jgi:hypothetical protein
MRARREATYLHVLESARFCLADGFGVVWAARRRGCSLKERVTSTDLIAALRNALRTQAGGFSSGATSCWWLGNPWGGATRSSSSPALPGRSSYLLCFDPPIDVKGQFEGVQAALRAATSRGSTKVR